MTAVLLPKTEKRRYQWLEILYTDQNEDILQLGIINYHISQTYNQTSFCRFLAHHFYLQQSRYGTFATQLQSFHVPIGLILRSLAWCGGSICNPSAWKPKAGGF